MALLTRTSSQQEFTCKLRELKSVLSFRGEVIDQYLNIIDKTSWQWRLLCLFRPFYTLLGYDAYSHVRVNRVVENFFKYCKTNQQYLDANLVKKIIDEILTPLNVKTKSRSQFLIDSTIHRLQSLLSTENKSSPKPVGPNNCRWLSTTETATGISVQQQQVFETALSCAYSSTTPKITYEKDISTPKIVHYLHVWEGPKMVRSFMLPMKIVIYTPPSKTDQVIIVTKKEVFGGEERHVRVCYNATLGEVLVKKQITSLEKGLLTCFQKTPARGVEKINFWRDYPNKTHVFEPFYEGTLKDLLTTDKQLLKDQTVKLSITKDLLCGLKKVHECSFSNLSFSRQVIRGDQKITYSLKADSVPVYHGDLKPLNILHRLSPGTGKREVVIIDFGASGRLLANVGSTGFSPPEQLQLMISEKPLELLSDDESTIQLEKQKDHNLKHGQAKDIWSMGLILTALVAEKTSSACEFFERIGLPPMPSIEKCINPTPLPSVFRDQKIISLTQQAIDDDLNNPAIISQSDLMNQSMLTIIREMLKVDPAKRISAKTALEMFNKSFPKVE